MSLLFGLRVDEERKKKDVDGKLKRLFTFKKPRSERADFVLVL